MIDSSALVAIVLEEPEAERFLGRRYGRGRSRAGLNFGDCCAYAAAVNLGEPLLFKGDDFARTDVERVDWQSL